MSLETEKIKHQGEEKINQKAIDGDMDRLSADAKKDAQNGVTSKEVTPDKKVMDKDPKKTMPTPEAHIY